MLRHHPSRSFERQAPAGAARGIARSRRAALVATAALLSVPLAGAAVAGSATAATTPATTTPATTTPAYTPASSNITTRVGIATGAGWLVWSAPVGAGWALEAQHDGATTTILRGATRDQPFDVSVGTSAKGTATAVFSRCTTTPTLPTLGEGIVDPTTGAGCRIHAVDLASGKETTPAIPAPAGTSDTTPAIHDGVIAFARTAHGQAKQQLRIWNPKASRATTSAPTGDLPSGGSATGTVQGLAFDGTNLAYLWAPRGTGVVGDGAWEIFVDRLHAGTRLRVASAVLGEACAGGANYELTPPILSGGRVSYVSTAITCTRRVATIDQVDPVAHRRSYADLAVQAIGLAGSNGNLVGLIASPTSATAGDPLTCTATAPCAIQQIGAHLTKTTFGGPRPPFV